MNDEPQSSSRPSDWSVPGNPFGPQPLDAARGVHRVNYAKDGTPGWIVSAHALGKEILLDQRLTIRQPDPTLRESGEGPTHARSLETLSKPFQDSFGLMDPPDHTRVRRAVRGRFSVRNVEKMRGRVEQLVSQQLDDMLSQGTPCDLISAFVIPVSLVSQASFLGVPESRSSEMQLFAKAFDPRTDKGDAIVAMESFRALIDELIALKRSSPADDPISDVVASPELSDAEVVNTLFLLLGAGHDTTGSMLGLAMFALLSDKDRLAAARDDLPSLEHAIEELLRYITVFPQAQTRTALTDLEFEGVTVRAGERVTVVLSLANRDPAVFSAPEAINIPEGQRGHLSFGFGTHVCLGQHLARLELQVAMKQLLERVPTLRLATSADTVDFRPPEFANRGVVSLPVTW